MRIQILALAVAGVLALAACGDEEAITTPSVEGAAASYAPVEYDCTAQSQIPEAECEALVALYNSTGGPGWTENGNWPPTSTEPCDWSGVFCPDGSDGGLRTVTEVDLPSNNLEGTIPAEIGNLGGLWFLRLDSNELSGPIPAELGNLSNLQVLQLESNKLSGRIPATLGNLSSLELLRLDSNQLWGSIPVVLSKLSNLWHLDLHANWLWGEIPAELGNLSNLVHLGLHWNFLSGTIPPELGNLGKLETMNLSNNQLTGQIPVELGNLANLKEVILVWNQLSGPIPPELGNLSKLEWLAVANNQLSGPIPPELGKLGEMGRMDFEYNQLSGAIPAELGNLSKLGGLGIGWNQLSGEIPAELGNLSALQSLHLCDNQLTGEIPAELGNLAELEHLYLFGNQLSGKIPDKLGNLSKLIDLHLAGNELDGKIPDKLGDLSYLENLWLNHNQLDGTIPAEFGNLAELKVLYLAGNKLSGEIPAELGNLGLLEELFINDNELGGQVPIEVAVLGGAAPLSDQCELMPGNWGLHMPDTQPYRDADVDGDGVICGLPLTATPGPKHNPVKEVIDLGTLGGSSFARAVSDDGMVVGGGFTTSGTLHPFSWTEKEGIRDLGSPHPGLQCEARDAIPGRIVGRCCEVFDGERLECEGPGEHAFAWGFIRKGWTLKIPRADGTCEDAAAFAFRGLTWGGCQLGPSQAMNAAVWGWDGEPWMLPGTDPEHFSVVSTAAYSSGYYRKNEIWHLVAGNLETASGDLHAFFLPVSWPRYDPGPAGNMRDLGTLGGSFSRAYGVNAEGQVVGVSETASGEQHAFLWTEFDGMIDLGTLGGGMSIATAINDEGQVVGYTEAYSTVVAFLWTRSDGMVVLPSFEGAQGWGAFDINNKGIVVGTSGVEDPDDHFRATMWVLK